MFFEFEGPYQCSVCGARYWSQEKASACEAKGPAVHELSVGTRFFMMGIVFEVSKLVGSAYVSHHPMILARVIEGDLSFLFPGEPVPERQAFDEATVKKYLLPPQRHNHAQN